ncbi:hypothetical protein ACMC56_10770 [Campylobacterota bacterium DY0563]
MKLNKFKYISSLLAFLIWFIWTYFVNLQSEHVLISSMTQGVYSAVVTLFMIYLIQYFCNLLPNNGIYFILPSIFTVTITTILIVFIHLLINTYDVFYTVLPTIFVAFLFSLYTTKQLTKKEQNA